VFTTATSTLFPSSEFAWLAGLGEITLAIARFVLHLRLVPSNPGREARMKYKKVNELCGFIRMASLWQKSRD
jgi:hypothetical protein